MTVLEQPRLAFDEGYDAKFAEYDAANPQIYTALRRFALEARAAGRPRLSIVMLFERVRWYTDIEGHGAAAGDHFKLNNNYRSRYARKLMAEHPELAGFFETRVLTT